MNKRRALVAVAVLAALAAAGAGTFWFLRNRLIQRTWIETPVVYAPFLDAVNVVGEVDSREYMPVNAPRAPYERQLIELVDEGKLIRKGDVIARFDPSPVFRHMSDLTNSIVNTSNNWVSSQMDFAIRIAGYRMEMSNAMERKKVNELTLETVKFESEYRKALAETTLRQTLIDIEGTQHRIDQTLYQKDIENRRASNWIRYLWQRVEDDKEYLKAYDVVAPVDSIAVYPLLTFGGLYRKVAIGDFLEYGREFMRLPVFSAYVVRLFLEERVINRVRVGVPARLSMRSIPDLRLKGRIENVAGYAKEELLLKTRRSFEIVVVVDPGKGVELLRPGMTVQVDLILNEYPAVFRVPRDFVELKDTRAWVWVVGALRPERKELKYDYETEDWYLVGREKAKGVFSSILPNKVAWFP